MHPAAASINLNKKIWDIYLKQLLPLFAVAGDDGNYAATASSDLDCLQVYICDMHLICCIDWYVMVEITYYLHLCAMAIDYAMLHASIHPKRKKEKEKENGLCYAIGWVR